MIKLCLSLGFLPVRKTWSAVLGGCGDLACHTQEVPPCWVRTKMASWDLPALAPVDTTPTKATLWWTQEPPSSSTAPLVPPLGPRDEGSAAAAFVMQPPPSSRSSGLSSAPTEGGWPAVHAWLVEAVRRRLLGPALQAYLAAPERRSKLREESFLKAFWEREKRRPEAALGAASEFLMIEQMRQELAERALPRKVLARLTRALT